MPDLGDPLPDLAVEIRDASGVLAAAGAVTLTLSLPDGTTTSPTVTTPSTGRYVASYVTVQAGRHHGRWVATGANACTHTQDWDIRPADDGGIVAVADVKRFLGIAATNTDNDEELRLYIDAATPIIEAEVGSVLRASRTDVVWGADELWLPRTPVLSVTSITSMLTGAFAPVLGELTIDLETGHVYRTIGGYLGFGAGIGFREPWSVVYTVGRTVIPGNITLAALIIVGHLWETQRGPADLPLATDSESPVPGYAIPRRALELLRPHRQMGGVA